SAGSPDRRYSFVHIDDLTDLYIRALDNARLLGGLTVNAANDYAESAEDILHNLVKVAGANGYEFTIPADFAEVAFETTSHIRPYLAKTLLGWQSQKLGFVEGLSIYYAAWKASHDDQPILSFEVFKQ
ncbi:hypothetical protein M422DRAFT_259888, partial [Sphaerobolus stellatus SS14]